MTTIEASCVCGGSPKKPNADCERCRLVWVVTKTREMRAKQRAYFSQRTGKLLMEAQELERIVDASIERLTALQPEFF